MMKNCVLGVLLILYFSAVQGQEKVIRTSVQTIGSYISPNHTPFWLRSNQYGSIPLDKASVSFIGKVKKDYLIEKSGIFDWGASFEGRANVGESSEFLLIEGYGKFKVGIFELMGGRSKAITGLCDTILTSGSFAVSGNSLGIPKVEVSIPQFYNIRVFDKLLAFKGSFSHGWLGKVPVYKLNHQPDNLKTYFHQLTFYGRLGKPSWKWKLFAGINHQVFWGSEAQYYGDTYTLSELKCYLYVISGKPYGSDLIPKSKIGNHLGSIDLSFEYEFTNTKIVAYHQFFYDIGALYHLANLRDGLNGISISNRKASERSGVKWKKVLFEFLYSKNQAGKFWSPATPSGDENYYNNYNQYYEGWSYQRTGIGSPFMPDRAYTQSNLPSDPTDYFINNRVLVFHVAMQGSLENWNFMLKESFSLNYGTYGTAEEGHSIGVTHFPPMYGIFPKTRQFSSFIEADRALPNQLEVGCVAAFDAGALYYNSFGLLLHLSKSF